MLVSKKIVSVITKNPKYTGDIFIPESIIYEGVECAVNSIGSSAFYGCSSLTSINIPSSVRTIEEKAFYNCSELADIYCYAEDVPSTESDAFDGSTLQNTTLHVPASAIANYRATSPWSSFGIIEAIDAGEEPAAQQCAKPKIFYRTGD